MTTLEDLRNMKPGPKRDELAKKLHGAIHDACVEEDRHEDQVKQSMMKAEREARKMEQITKQMACPLMSYRSGEGRVYCIRNECMWWNKCRKILEDSQ